MDPPMVNLVLSNLFDLSFSSPKKNPHGPPPWGVGAGGPTRGVALEYTTISLKKFKSLNFPPDLLVQPSFLFIWIANHSFFDTISWAQDKGYALVYEIVWIKRHNSGSLAGSLGRYLQHAQETFPVAFAVRIFPRCVPGDSQVSGSLPIVTNPQMNSFKPLELYTILEETWPYMNYLELSGTNRNLRSKWTTVGLGLTPHFSWNYLIYDRED
eukprot:maker-scaffold_19-snap-gene-1.8-mRNA-1 protein AED:0.17 eAED:0.23 QI:0/0/0/0.66/0/0/3/0/211